MLKYLIFDLDETLYPRDAGLMQEIGARITRYLIDHLKLSEAEALLLRQRYFQQYGTALRGLIVEQPEANPEDYLKFVHDIPLTKYIGPNPALNEMLRSIPLTKIVFTNATIEHAQKVLGILGIPDCFARIIDIRMIDYISKPDRRAYEKMLALIDAQPNECILVEDSARNLMPAKSLGLTTILVDNDDCAEVDYCVKDILGVKQAVDGLMERMRAGANAR
jgi:putative hydrolase of the HAD superfamily